MASPYQLGEGAIPFEERRESDPDPAVRSRTFSISSNSCPPIGILTARTERGDDDVPIGGETIRADELFENSEARAFHSEPLEFLRRCENHFKRQLGPPEQWKLLSEPTKIILDTGDCHEVMGWSDVHANAETLFRRDLEKIELSQLHDSFNNKQTRHTMILGDAGAGKTTLSKMYAAAAADGNINVLQNVELIHYVMGYQLQCDCESTAFDLLFKQQLGGNDLDTALQQAGQKWVQRNQDKILIIIDGLDQCNTQIQRQRYPYIDYTTPAKCDCILANILSRKIWPKVLILTTSRWSVYWNLMPEQAPCKVIGLRGFDEMNLGRALNYHITDSVKREAFMNHLMTNSPRLHALCKNPLLLKYAASTFHRGQDNVPDSMSGLMSAVFSEFFGFLIDPKLKDLTKLAHYGMKDNMFQFPPDVLERLEVPIEGLEGFITTGADVQPGQRATKLDLMYLFTHQVMQEFCAALHILTMSVCDATEYISTSLNETNMEMVRKLFYGVVMDDKTTRVMRAFLRGATCSIKEYRQILLEQLNAMIPDGVIRDIGIITLLNECGPATIQRINPRVNSVSVSVLKMAKQDQMILANVITQCSPLDEIYVREFWLNPTLLHSLIKCHRHAEIYLTGYEVETSIDRRHIDDVLKLLDNTALLFVMLHSDDEVKNEFLRLWIGAAKVPFQSLGLINVNSTMTMNLLLQLTSKVSSLRELKICFGDKIDTKTLQENLTNRPSGKVERIRITDRSLTEEKVNAYLTIFQLLKGSRLALHYCNLTIYQLGLITQSCREREIKLTSFTIWDNVLPAGGFHDIVSILFCTQCKNVLFGNCFLDREKLLHFEGQCKESNIKLQDLHIKDRDMKSGAYECLASILKATSCQELSLDECDLTKDKLLQLRRGCEKWKVKLTTINIWDRSISPAGLQEIASIVRETSCENLYFLNCNLTQDALSTFNEFCRMEDITIKSLFIKDRHPLLDLHDRNFSHIHGFKSDEQGRPCTNEALKPAVQRIIEKRYSPSADMISCVCDLMFKVVSQIEIAGWVIDDKDQRRLNEVFLSQESMVVSMKLPDL